MGPLRDPCGPDLRDPSRDGLFYGGWTLRDPMALPGVQEGDAPLGLVLGLLWEACCHASLDGVSHPLAVSHECLVSIFSSFPSWEVKPLAASDGPRYIAPLVSG